MFVVAATANEDVEYPSRRNTPAQLSRHVLKSLTTLDLLILGYNRHNIDKVKKEIDRCCSQESQDRVIGTGSSAQFSDVIKKLGREEVGKSEKIQYTLTCGLPR